MPKKTDKIKQLFELAATARAAELIEQKRSKESLGLLNEASTLLPDSALLAYDLGVVHTASGEHAEAIAAYSKALKENPNFPEALNNLGAALAQKGNLKESIANYERALALRSDYPAALYNLGNALLKERVKEGVSDDKGIDKAVDYYRKALKIDPKNGGVPFVVESSGWRIGS